MNPYSKEETKDQIATNKDDRKHPETGGFLPLAIVWFLP
jgi:hypothetical protein